MALRHVESGRRIVDRQRALVARRKALGVNTDVSESLLEAFKRSQAIFEDDLADLDRKRPLDRLTRWRPHPLVTRSSNGEPY
jgi:hypothetical protein